MRANAFSGVMAISLSGSASAIEHRPVRDAQNCARAVKTDLSGRQPDQLTSGNRCTLNGKSRPNPFPGPTPSRRCVCAAQAVDSSPGACAGSDRRCRACLVARKMGAPPQEGWRKMSERRSTTRASSCLPALSPELFFAGGPKPAQIFRPRASSGSWGFYLSLSDATKTDAAQLASILVRRRRSELAMTLTEDNAIAAAAIVGERSRPKVG